jgi:hypothetical protein
MQLVWRMRYYPAVGPAIPRASVGRSRVTHPFAGHPLRGAHDLHVLSTPPAFVLSQDQTLQEKVRSSSSIALASPYSREQTQRCVRITKVIVGQTLPSAPTRAPDQRVRPARLSISTSVVKQLHHVRRTASRPPTIWCRIPRQPWKVVRDCEQVKCSVATLASRPRHLKQPRPHRPRATHTSPLQASCARRGRDASPAPASPLIRRALG